MDNLLQVASDPAFIFNTTSFDKLNNILISVVENACERENIFLFGLFMFSLSDIVTDLREKL